MWTIEEIAHAFEALEPATGDRWNVETLVPGRLHISRGATGQYTVFLEGSLDSFGSLPPVGGLEHSTAVTALPSSREFAVLRISCRDQLHGDRVLSHIAYELARRLVEHPPVTNAELFRQVEWVLLLLGGRDAVLSPERQLGLAGECVLLRKLLVIARKRGLSSMAVLERWWGHQPARRDFAALDIAIEVKTTSQNARQHQVGSIEQLDPQSPSEELYIFSLGMRSDVTAPRKLPHFVDDVEAQLITMAGAPDPSAIALFQDQLKAYGYERARLAYYLNGPGYLKPHLAGALFPERDLERLRHDSFVGGQLPNMVIGVSYVLQVTSEPLADAVADQVFERLLRSPPVSHQAAT
jgi:hypothetical protein